MSTTDYLTEASPPWLKELDRAKTEQKRTVFLLHFNIRDVVFDPNHPPDSPQALLRLTDYLAQMLAYKRDAVLYYSLHSGIEVYEGDKPVRQRYDEDDPERTWLRVARHAAAHPYALSETVGGEPEDRTPERWRTPAQAIPLLTRALTQPYFIRGLETEESDPPQHPTQAPKEAERPLRLGIIIDYLEHLVPGAGYVVHRVPEIVEALQRWSADQHIVEHRHDIVLLARELSAIHSELQGTDSHIAVIPIPRPDRDARAQFLQWLSTFSGPDEDNNYSILLQENLVDKLANRTSGMNYSELLDFVQSMRRHPEQHWEALLAARRAEIIQRESGGLLVPKESKYGLNDIAGYQYVREYVDRLIPRLREGRADVTGILFAGPPGTGKSFFASALAKDAGVNVVVMRDVRQMWVGQSERNMEQVLRVARSLAPVVIFVDEIDQAFASRQGNSNDGGVEQRLLGRLLEFMDDKQNLGQVIWVAASNRPELIDAALLSRFKLRIPFLLPDRETCMELLKVHLPRQAEYRWQEETWDSRVERVIAQIVGEYSGRELETIVRTALWKAEDADARWTENISPRPIIHTREGEKEIPLVNAAFLVEAIRDSSVGHDRHEYLRQALLALQSTPFSSTTLIDAVNTAFPAEYVSQIVRNNQLDKEAIGRALEALTPSVRWR